MKNLLKKIILIFFKKSFFFDAHAIPLIEINKQLKNLKPLTRYSFGNLNKDKKFLVIKRSPGAGLFSNITFVINFILYSNKNKFIPIIDMKNFPTIYNEKKLINKTKNSWEYYFEKLNKYNLNNIYKSRNVFFTSSNFISGMSLDITNKKLRKTFKKIKFRKKYKNLANKFFKKKFNKKDKILGVHFRGSTYKVARGHAFPPSPKIMLEQVDFLIKKFNYNKVFLVTEEQSYLEIFEKKYKKNCISYKSFRMKDKDSFKIYPRTNHRYKLGEEIIVETIILSQCDGLSFIKSNVISAAICLSKKKQHKHEIFLGINSRNKFIARWLWYIKNILPEMFGGLKILNKQ